MNIELNRWVDRWIGSFILMFLGLFKSKRDDPKKIRNVLFMQWWGMGESLLTLPAMKWFKENTKIKVHVMTTERVKDVFDQPFIDEVKVFNMSVFGMAWFILKNFRKYDLVVDMEEYLYSSTIISMFVGKYTFGFETDCGRDLMYDHTSKFEKQHMVKNFCDLGGAEYPDKLVPITFEEVETNLTRPVGLFCGTAESCTERSWPIEKWQNLYIKLIEKGYSPYFVFGPNEEPIKNFNSISPEDIKKLAGYMKTFEWFVSNDTGPMHLAAAMGTKTVGLFGPNLPVLWAPYGQHSVYFPVECSPCIHNVRGDMGGCVSNLCMQNIDVEDVLDVIQGT